MKRLKNLAMIAMTAILFASCEDTFDELITDFQCVDVLEGHRGSVNSVCWSPDGKYIASGSSDQDIVIWNANTGQKVRTLYEYYKSVNQVAWSPDGNYLACRYYYDDNIILYNPNNGTLLDTLKVDDYGNNYVYSLAWSPDGEYLASGDGVGHIVLWNPDTKEKVKTLEGDWTSVYSLAWSPDGRYLASGLYNHDVVIWDVNSGERLKTLKGHSYGVYSVSWSPDGKYLASGSYNEAVIIWNVNNGERERMNHGYYDVYSVAWSPDGKYLASSGSNIITLWDSDTGENLQELEVTDGYGILSLSWSPNGKYLLSGSRDGSICIWSED